MPIPRKLKFDTRVEKPVVKVRKCDSCTQTSEDVLLSYVCDLFLKEIILFAAERQKQQSQMEHEAMMKKIRHIIFRIKAKAASNIGLATNTNSNYKAFVPNYSATISPSNRYLSPQDRRSWHFDIGPSGNQEESSSAPFKSKRIFQNKLASTDRQPFKHK